MFVTRKRVQKVVDDLCWQITNLRDDLTTLRKRFTKEREEFYEWVFQLEEYLGIVAERQPAQTKYRKRKNKEDAQRSIMDAYANLTKFI